jgi:TPR repeat protein
MRGLHRVAWLILWTSLGASAADIGGWMQHKARIDTAARDDCAQRIADAGRTAREAEGAAQHYYQAGVCYLHSDSVARDEVAASAWLTRAAELDHPLARRALLALRDNADAKAHPAGYHCHELGLGRRLCHGGVVMP